MRQSPARLAKFKECALVEKIQSKSSLCLDVSTRWNSTYLMLDVAQKFEKAFESFDDVDPYYKSELLMGDGLPEKKIGKMLEDFAFSCTNFMNLQLKFQGLLMSHLTAFLMIFVMFMSLCVIGKQILILS